MRDALAAAPRRGGGADDSGLRSYPLSVRVHFHADYPESRAPVAEILADWLPESRLAEIHASLVRPAAARGRAGPATALTNAG